MDFKDSVKQIGGKIIFCLLLISIIGCSSDDEEEQILGGGVEVKYKVTNNISNETITIIKHETIKGEPVVKNITSVKPGETTSILSMETSGWNSHTLAFRTSIKQYNGHNDFETVEFITLEKEGIVISLMKNKAGRYYTEVVEE